MDTKMKELSLILKDSNNLDAWTTTINEFTEIHGAWIHEHIDFIENNYNEIMLFDENDIQIFIICWDKNTESKPHYHTDFGCFMKILQGSVKEDIIIKTDKSVDIFNKYSHSDEISFVNKCDIIHNIINQDEQSITLHISFPQILF
jgi:hypothetical protein